MSARTCAHPAGCELLAAPGSIYCEGCGTDPHIADGAFDSEHTQAAIDAAEEAGEDLDFCHVVRQVSGEAGDVTWKVILVDSCIAITATTEQAADELCEVMNRCAVIADAPL